MVDVNTFDAELALESHDGAGLVLSAAGFPGTLFRPAPGTGGGVRGRVVLVHGLNLAPSTMDPLARWLAGQGFVVARVELSGHRQSFRELMRVRQQDWLSDISAAVQALGRLEGEARSTPLAGVGFSLGGLLLAHHVRQAMKKDSWSGLALLAPAFVPRLGGSFPLGILPRWLPYFSLTPRKYRRWAFCPHNAYIALGSLMRAHLTSLREISGSGHDDGGAADQPRCVVLVHPRDELVHAGRLADPVFGIGFSRYEVRLMRGVHRKWSVPRHLICHPDALTHDAWRDLCAEVLAAITPGA